MGPQLVRCGMQKHVAVLAWLDPLQWGRNLFVAECPHKRDVQLHGDAASMGPQLVRCGMLLDSLTSKSQSIASMGPQLVRCGMLVPTPVPIHKDIASMGPQLVRCGMQE